MNKGYCNGASVRHKAGADVTEYSRACCASPHMNFQILLERSRSHSRKSPKNRLSYNLLNELKTICAVHWRLLCLTSCFKPAFFLLCFTGALPLRLLACMRNAIITRPRPSRRRSFKYGEINITHLTNRKRKKKRMH